MREATPITISEIGGLFEVETEAEGPWCSPAARGRAPSDASKLRGASRNVLGGLAAMTATWLSACNFERGP